MFSNWVTGITDGGGIQETLADDELIRMLIFVGLITLGLRWLTLKSDKTNKAEEEGSYQCTVREKALDYIVSLLIGEAAGWWLISNDWHPAFVIGAAMLAGLGGRDLANWLLQGLKGFIERKSQGE